jgi:signal transduction histidine kinase
MAIRWPRPTVRLRLTLTYTALFVVTGAALLAVNYFLVQHREGGARTATAIICRGSVESGTSVTVGAGERSSVPLSLNPADCPGVVGAVYYHSSVNGSSSASSSGSGSGSGAVVPPGHPIQISGPTAAEISQLTATVAASQAHALGSLRLGSFLALGLLAIVAVGLSWWMAGRVLRPVHRITDAARRLSEQTLYSRINLKGPNDELKELADTFDAMLGRLDRAFRSQQRFVANASHELRTPLATERVLIDEALGNRSAKPEELRTILEQLRTNSEETERLMDALLVLARSEQGIERWADVDLAGTAEAALDAAAPEATFKGVEIRSNLAPVAVKGDSGLLERLVGNVVENGIRHNDGGGWVEVKTRRVNSHAVLEVSNTGPVLDPTTVATLTEPFRRAGPDRSADEGGFGLGLSIVDGLVDAHHGSMTLSPRSGGGLVVQVQLPLATTPVQV